jgi:hypothetical protein
MNQNNFNDLENETQTLEARGQYNLNGMEDA